MEHVAETLADRLLVAPVARFAVVDLRALASRAAGICAAALCWSASALAQEDAAFPAGRYSSEAGCPNTDIHAKGNPTLLSPQGLEAVEYYCEFARITPVFDGDAWLVDVACQEPGFFFPDRILVARLDDVGDVLSVVHQGATERFRYYRCPK